MFSHNPLSYVILGTIDFDLSAMPLPVKRARNCRLSQTSDGGKTDNLFKRGRMEGWWPAHVLDKKGKRKLKVTASVNYYICN